MAPRLKQDYPALIAEYERRIAAGESLQAVKRDFTARGITFGTFDNQRRAFKKKTPTPQKPTMIEEPVDVLPGQMRIEDTDTPPEVHDGAVNEFDALPAGYAKEIQPMRQYTDAEEWALNESLRLYGFFGTIIRDQYGRTLDGHHRERLARRRGLGVPFVIRPVKDDREAMAIARAANAVRRHMYTQEQRQELANGLRDQGFSYRAIADALGVGKSTVYRDIFGELRERDEDEPQPDVVPVGQVNREFEPSDVPEGQVDRESIQPVTPTPEKRIEGKDGKSYPDRKPKPANGTKAKTSPADRQLAQVINLLMSHAQQWNDQHWQAFLEVVQNLRGGREVPAPE